MPIDFRGEPTKYAPESNRPSAPTVGVGVLYIASDTDNVFRSDGATWTEVGALPLGQVFDVKSYGAKGDGVTDDTAAINLAITAASVAGGVVFFPVGRYVVTSTLTISSHSVSIVGASRGLAPGEYGGTFPYGAQIVGVNGTDLFHVGNCGYFTMRDITLYIPAGATSACTGILLNQSYNAHIENVRIANFSKGIKLTTTTDVYVNHCYIGSNGVTVTPTIGVDIDGTTTQNASVFLRDVIVALATFTGTAYGFYLHGNRINDIAFDECEADFVTYGWYINGTGVNAGYGGDIWCRGCIADSVTIGYYISSCTVDSAISILNGWSASSGPGVAIDGNSNNVTVAGMQIYGATNGVSITGGSGHIIDHNKMMYCSQNGVLLAGSPVSLTISHNVFIAKAGSVMSGAIINAATGTINFSMVGNVAKGTAVDQFANGIVCPAGCDPFTAVANVMPGAYVTVPYNLNLGSNVNSKDVANI